METLNSWEAEALAWRPPAETRAETTELDHSGLSPIPDSASDPRL